jgi:predicted DNA-binding protein
MKKIENEIVNLGMELKTCLESESLKEEARDIETLLEERDIWDRMAIRMDKRIQVLLTSKKLGKKTRKIAANLRKALTPYISNIKEYPVYESITSLIDELRRIGLHEWEERLDKAMKSGSTGGEICMAIRHHLKELEDLSLPLSSKSKKLIERIYHQIADAFEEKE